MSAALAPLPAPLPDGIVGAFTTRGGGLSAGPWTALNLALHVGDEPRRVLANRELLAGWLGTGPVHLAQQVHGAAVLTVDQRRRGGRRSTPGGPAGCDALVTARPDVALGVLVADCLPVLFADVAAGVVGVAHAGRAGLAAGILQHTVERIVELGGTAAGTVAAIGPGVGGCCYEVPPAMRDEVAAVVPATAATTTWGTASLDLPAGAAAVLTGLGLGRVERVPVCTVEDQRFYSYRRDGVTGRFAGVVVRRG